MGWHCAVSWSLLAIAHQLVSVLLQACTENVDEGPLGVPLEEVSPYFQHGETETLGVQPESSLFLLVKVYYCVRFFDNAPNPV